MSKLYFVRMAANSVVLSSEPVGRQHSYVMANVAGMEIPVFRPRTISFGLFSWQRTDELGNETALSRAVRARFGAMSKGAEVPGLKLSNRKLVLEDGTVTDTYWCEATAPTGEAVKMPQAPVSDEDVVMSVIKGETEKAKSEKPEEPETSETPTDEENAPS